MLRRALNFICAVILMAISGGLLGSASCLASTYNLSYDEVGRLVGIVDATGNAATYGYDALGNIVSIARGSGAVSITSFAPGSGAVGTPVTISGFGFSATPSQNTVTFNGTAAQVTSATTNQVIATVPAGATTGPISVTSPNGTATSSSSFSVIATSAPTITSFSPTIGTPGTALTVNGTNFQATVSEDNLTLNGRATRIVTATATTLGTTVPTSSTSGRFTLTTPYGMATSGQDFFVPPGTHVPGDVGVTGRMTIGGTQTVTLSAANKIGMILFDGTPGQRVSLLVTASSFSSCGFGSLQVISPDSSVLGSVSSLCAGGFSESAFALGETGTYTIVLAPASGATGSASFTLYNVPADPTATITIGGSAVSVTTTTPGQNETLTFSGTAGQRISLNMTEDSNLSGYGYITFLNPDGTTLSNSAMSGSYFSDVLTLPTTGTYTIKLDPSGTKTGTATYTLYNVPPDPTSTITIGGGAVSVTTNAPGQNETLTFSGTAGQRVSLNMTEDSNLSGFGYITFLNPDGSTLSNSAMSGNYFSDVLTLPTTGTYTIKLDPSGTKTGTATYTLYNVPPDPTSTITIGGGAVSVTTNAPGQNETLTFSGTAGQRVSLNMTEDSNLSGFGYITFLNPDGSTLSNSAMSGNYFSDVLTLPTTGTYTIKLDPSGTKMGTATFTLYNVPPDPTATITVGGSPVSVTTIAPGQNETLTFSGTAGQRISLYLTEDSSLSSFGYVTFLKPDGSTLSNGAMSVNYFSDVLTLPTTGTYTVKLDPSGMNTGTATFTLYNVPPDPTATIAVGGSAVSLTTTTPGQNANLTFSGTASQLVSLSLSEDSSLGSCGYVSFVNPDGSTLANNFFCTNYTGSTLTLPQTGAYTIKLDPPGMAVGTASFTLRGQ